MCIRDRIAHLRARAPAWLARWVTRREAPEMEMTLTGHEGWVSTVAVTADGRQAISGGDDGTVRLWSLTTGVEERTLIGHQNGVNLSLIHISM